MTKAEKMFGLTVEEIAHLKIWFVNQQDFEIASWYREMERKALGEKLNNVIIKKPSGKLINIIRLKFRIYKKDLRQNWYLIK